MIKIVLMNSLVHQIILNYIEKNDKERPVISNFLGVKLKAWEKDLQGSTHFTWHLKDPLECKKSTFPSHCDSNPGYKF